MISDPTQGLYQYGQVTTDNPQSLAKQKWKLKLDLVNIVSRFNFFLCVCVEWLFNRSSSPYCFLCKL